jgi:hypothetical protein
VSTGESSDELSALSPALAQAQALTGTKSRTAKASSSVGKRRRPASGMLEGGTPCLKSGFARSFIFLGFAHL